jgi:hypothetical protein
MSSGAGSDEPLGSIVRIATMINMAGSLVG